MHRRCTEDAQIVLFKYDVGIAQTQAKAMSHKIRKADVPMKWASISYPTAVLLMGYPAGVSISAGPYLSGENAGFGA
jgi:hypothetical protein